MLLLLLPDGVTRRQLTLVTKQTPTLIQALLQRGKLHIRTCSLASAMADFRTLVASPSVNTEVSQEARQLLSEAEEAAQSLKLMDSQNHSVAASLELLTKILTVCPQDVRLRMQRAELFEKNGELAQAIGDYT